MKSNLDFTRELIQKVKAKRRKKRTILASVSLGVCALLAFAVGYSNIITIDFDRYAHSYASYLAPYATADSESAAFRFVDDKSALVQIDNKAYPCAYEANSESDFTLTVVESEEESYSVSEEEPSIFYLEFWDTSAKLSWNILGTRIEKILSVTDERNIPAGLWGLCATQDGDGGKITEKENGAGWTLILENGDSYTGEGMDSAWKTKFISIGDKLFQCMFDTVSGVILDASYFVYDETTFDYPVIREHYLSDGDPYYFYSRLLTEEDKIDFKGGRFEASAATIAVETERLEKNELVKDSMIKWKLSPTKSHERKALPLKAMLSLNEDGTLKLKISGNADYNGTFSGKWYALRHSILVTLDKKSKLLGNAFTVYAKDNFKDPTGEAIEQYGRSYLENYDLYKIGYHVFDYYASQSIAEIYWGAEWTPETVNPTLQYEKTYTLYGEYYYDHFDGTPPKNLFDFEESMLRDIPVNGQVHIVFHKDGTATVTTPDETETLQFEIDEYSQTNIQFSDEFIFYVGSNMPMEYTSNWRSYTLRFTSLIIEPDGLHFGVERYVHQSVSGSTEEYVEIVYYRCRFILNKEN